MPKATKKQLPKKTHKRYIRIKTPEEADKDIPALVERDKRHRARRDRIEVQCEINNLTETLRLDETLSTARYDDKETLDDVWKLTKMRRERVEMHKIHTKQAENQQNTQMDRDWETGFHLSEEFL